MTTRRNLGTATDTTSESFYAPSDEYPNFESIGVRSPILLQRIQTLFSITNKDGNMVNTADVASRPSAVQSASYPIISAGTDVTIGAETGSGKTLAYLLPLLDDILQRKAKSGGDLGYGYARAIILVPNKELANQVLRMAMHLCGGPESLIWNGGASAGSQSSYYTDEHEEPPSNAFGIPDAPPSSLNDTVRLGLFPGGLKLLQDYKPFRMTNLDPQNNPPLDLVVTTPASLGPLGLNPKNLDLFADVQTLVIDEADMLFDGGYLRALENVLLGFKRADRLVIRTPPEEEEEDGAFGVRKTQHVLVAATLPDMGLKSVDAYVKKKFPYAENLTMGGMHNARHNGLRDPTVWIEDDVEDYGQVNKNRLERLLTLLQTRPNALKSGSSPATNGLAGLAGEKVMVFLNSVEDVDGATNALRRAGINAVPFHAKIPLSDRTKHLNDFRSFVADTSTTEGSTDRFDPVVLVCTDLAARGLDVPGVTAVVQLQFAGNVVAHLHRMGRCGRAGNKDGRGIVFYGGAETELVEVVRAAEMQQERMVLEGNDVVEQKGIEDDKVVGAGGKVNDAFSRKRGFTRKRKKLRRRSIEGED